MRLPLGDNESLDDTETDNSCTKKSKPTSKQATLISDASCTGSVCRYHHLS